MNPNLDEALATVANMLARIQLSKEDHAKLDACLEVIKSNLKPTQPQ